MLHYRESVHRTEYTKFPHFRSYSQRENRSTIHGRCILPFSSAHGRSVHGRSILPFRSIHGSSKLAIQLCQHKFCPRKEYLAIQFHPQKLYFAIQIRSRKQDLCNFTGSSQTTDQLDTQISQGSGSTKPSLSIADLPLTQEKVESTYADMFQGLGKFPGEPYKLRLKPDAVPAKHRPRKVPVHLQEAFHEEVERLVKIDVLEPVTEPTEWVNSFVVVEKVIDSSNAHSPHHSIKKSNTIVH